MADVKHQEKFKARLVTDGYLAKEPTETVYSGVASLRNLRLTMFLAELSNLQLWEADVGNAYLQALTPEKLYIVTQNMESYKDMFLLCTRHSMEESVLMTTLLTFFNKWISCNLHSSGRRHR